MPRWLPVVLKRIHELAARGRVRFTLKALRELASLDVGLDEADACELLQHLRAVDSGGRLRSKLTREWLYVFLPRVGGQALYLKVLLRSDCIIISFHEQVDDDEEDAEP
jgi:MqsR (Motility quorum-sensing regulator) toxin of toxin-antitoxin system